jgi:fumarate hydratase subunit alpha
MRVINTDIIVKAVMELCQEINFCLSDDMAGALDRAAASEESDTGKKVLGLLKKNAQIAEQEKLALCQDCGLAVVFAEVGQEVFLEGTALEDAINQGVREGYSQGYLRKSVVKNPLERVNTGDNTPAIIHTRVVPGDQVTITVAAKGGGSENMGSVKMLQPADGVAGIKEFVIETVERADANPCPPIIVGVGIGGTMEKAALLSKQALLRPLDTRNPDPKLAEIEAELLERINELGIGPQGMGGRITALGVHIEDFPTHIACLPVAVSINCHCARHREVVL